MTRDEKLFRARDLHNSGEYIEALEIVTNLLDEDPEDAPTLFLLAVILISTNKIGMAYHIASKVLSKVPERAEAWVNFGKCQQDTPEGWEQSEQCFMKSLELRPDYTLAMDNLASIMILQCRIDDGFKWAEKALEIDPNDEKALSCLGFLHLMAGNWEEGFKNYDYILGQSSRPFINYNNAPRWEGENGKTIMVNGEQGIGDELIYSSFLRDVAKNNKVVYDCMPRLKNLMTRSFKDEPNIYVSGNRWGEETVLPDEFMPNACASIASLGQYIRKTDDDFDGKPYIVPDQDMKASIRGLLDSLGPKPKIGIAWTGGTKQSRQQFRQRTLEELVPLIRNKNVDWISLQYKDCDSEINEMLDKRGIKVHHFPWITEIKDYDMTAALVSELDLIIAVPTSATQLGGAVGTETWVMVPEITGWLFHRDNYVWANSVKLFRNKPVKYIADQLNHWLSHKAAA